MRQTIFPLKKTINSLKNPPILGIAFLCGVLAVASILLIVAGVSSVSHYFLNFKYAWLNHVMTFVAGSITGVIGWFFLPVFISLFAGVFVEYVQNIVEKKSYPKQQREQSPRFWPDFKFDIRFTAISLGLNLLILPTYFIGIGFIASIVLNSYLLGREFFETAAGYHLGKPMANKLRVSKPKSIYFGGFVITLITLTPIINVFSPIFAIVWMIHLYQGEFKGNT